MFKIICCGKEISHKDNIKLACQNKHMECFCIGFVKNVDWVKFLAGAGNRMLNTIFNCLGLKIAEKYAIHRKNIEKIFRVSVRKCIQTSGALGMGRGIFMKLENLL